MAALVSELQPGLTPRQREVLALLAAGEPDKVIAERLGISERAIRFHLAECRSRLGARSRSHLVAVAAAANLLPAPRNAMNAGVRDPRIGSIPAQEKAAIVACGQPAQTPNLFHETRLWSADPLAYIEADGVREVLVASADADRARREASADRVVEVPIPTDRSRGARASESALAKAILQSLIELGVKRVIAHPDFPMAVADALRDAGLTVNIDDELEDRRRSKSDVELDAIGAAARATDDALARCRLALSQAGLGADHVLELDGAGLTEQRLERLIEACLSDHGCFAELILVTCGGSTGERKRTSLVTGIPVTVEIVARHRQSRMCAGLARTLCRGVPQPEVSRMFRVVTDVQHAVLHFARAGHPGREIHAFAEDLIWRAGYATLRPGQQRAGVATFSHALGNGIGLEPCEPPSVSSGQADLMREGDVLCVGPSLYLPGVGSVRMRDTVVVSLEGCRLLTRAPATVQIE